MFSLTKREQWIVAFVVSALVLGTVVKEWRARHPRPLNETQSQARTN